jgi:hypothetical protein
MITKDEAIKMAIKALLYGADHTNAVKACKEALEQPAQEPVAIVYSMQDGYVGQMIVKDIAHKTPLYTHPHQWQGLTDDEIIKAFKANHCDDLEDAFICGIQFAEVILKEKNT